MTTILNYSLNKFCPYLIILFVLLYNTDFSLLRTGIILGTCVFLDKFSFKAGYSYAYCIKNNINLDND